MKYVHNLVLVAIFGPMLLALGIICYWLFLDVTPPWVNNSTEIFDGNGISRTRFRAGDIMVVRRDRCVIDTGEAVFTRRLIRVDHGEVYFMPSGPQHLDLGCLVTYNSVRLPIYAGPGEYDYVVTLTFAKNPLLTVEQTLPAPRIQITE